MKTQIHELRTRIDVLAQLVKPIIEPMLIVDVNSIPDGMTIDEIIEEWNNHQNLFVCKTSTVERVSFFDSSCIGECHRSLLLAKAWLGKVLAELGEETPYKNDGNRKTVEDIEPTADVSTYYFDNAFPPKVENEELKDMTYIEKIDWLREEIGKIARDIELNVKVGGILNEIAWKYLTEARFFLGFELQRLKEQSNKKQP